MFPNILMALHNRNGDVIHFHGVYITIANGYMFTK